MSITKRASNNIFWLFMSEVGAKGLIFMGTIYLARVLGKAGFGLFSLSLAVGVYFWTIVDMGVTGYGTREIARNKEKTAKLYSLLNSLRLVLAVSLFLIFCGVLYLVDISQDKRLILIAGGFYVIGYSLSSDWVFRGLEKMQYIAFGSIFTSLFFLTSIYLFTKDSSGVFWASLAYSCSFLMGSLSLIIILHRKLKIPFFLEISFTKWWVHIKESFYFAINGAFNNVSLFIPIFFMGIWNTAEDLGTFSAPHRLATIVIRAGGLIIMALYPVLSSLYVTNIEDFKRAHAGFQKMIIWIAIPICIIATLLSKDIVAFLFGASYADSSGIFNILIWLSFLMITRYSFGNALLSANFHRFNMFATGAGSTVVALASMILIPGYGGYGAAWALISGEIITLLLMSGLFRGKLGFSDFSKLHLVRILFAGVIMGLIIRILRFPPIPSAVVGILVYGVMSLSIGIITKQKVMEIYQGVVGR